MTARHGSRKSQLRDNTKKIYHALSQKHKAQLPRQTLMGRKHIPRERGSVRCEKLNRYFITFNAHLAGFVWITTFAMSFSDCAAIRIVDMSAFFGITVLILHSWISWSWGTSIFLRMLWKSCSNTKDFTKLLDLMVQASEVAHKMYCTTTKISIQYTYIIFVNF